MNMKRLKENVDYELIPFGDNETWSIRFLKGDFLETVIQYDILKMEDDGELKYNFSVINSPNDEAVVENIYLQELVGDVLFSIINTLHENDWFEKPNVAKHGENIER